MPPLDRRLLRLEFVQPNRLQASNSQRRSARQAPPSTFAVQCGRRPVLPGVHDPRECAREGNPADPCERSKGVCGTRDLLSLKTLAIARSPAVGCTARRNLKLDCVYTQGLLASRPHGTSSRIDITCNRARNIFSFTSPAWVVFAWSVCCPTLAYALAHPSLSRLIASIDTLSPL